MPPRNRRTQTRAIDWRGEPTPAAREAERDYLAHLADLGLIERPWVPPPLPYYAAALPELEKGET